MTNKLTLLKQATGKEWKEIVCNGKTNENYFINDEGDEAFIIEKQLIHGVLKQAALEEISYLDNDLLKNFLPEKLHEQLILDELKELSKFDHTILSKYINDLNEYCNTVWDLENNHLILENSVVLSADDYLIYYASKIQHDMGV